LAAGGCANAAAQDPFCLNTTCIITVIYDRTSRHNDLTIGVAGVAGVAGVGVPADELPPAGTSPTGPRSPASLDRPARPGKRVVRVVRIAQLPRRFLRNYNYQLYRQPMDGHAVFRADATFCPQIGQGGTGRVVQLPIRSSGTTQQHALHSD